MAQGLNQEKNSTQRTAAQKQISIIVLYEVTQNWHDPAPTKTKLKIYLCTGQE